MKRSPGVTVIAILSLIGSGLTLLMGFVMLLAMALAPAPEAHEFPGSPVFFRVILLASSLMYFGPAVWGILTGIGLLRLKSWARISIIAFSVLLLLMSGFGGLISLFVPIPATPSADVDASVITAIRIGMGVFWLALVGIGVWWLVFFNRSKVKEQFRQFAPALSSEPSLGIMQAAQGPAIVAMSNETTTRPVSITVIAWLLLAGCIFLPLSVLLHSPAILFTRMLTGWPAALFYLSLAAAQLWIGIGLLRLRPAARTGAIAYLSFGFLNSAVFNLAPGAHARLYALIDSQQAMFPWMRMMQSQPEFHVDPTPFLIIGSVFGLALLTVTLYLLITSKPAFDMPVHAGPGETPV